MNYISLNLDEKARAMAAELLHGLDENDGWIKMTARLAAQVDEKLSENRYLGTVIWFSDSDYIEKEIEYR